MVIGLCSWELLALLGLVPIPTLSQSVRKIPTLGWVILGLLAHHWYLEKVVDDAAAKVASSAVALSGGRVVTSIPSPQAGR